MMSETTTAERWRSLVAKIDRRLMDATTTPAVAKELREIKAKLTIMGPTFIDSAHEKRIEALFDKRTH